MQIDDFWAVIPAGGAGTRLWPLSRRGRPKFLHDLRGRGRTLLQETHDRLAPLAGDRMLVVTGQAHVEAVVAQLSGLPASAFLAEPSPRDSMAAIGLAAARLERRHPETVMGSFAADQVIADDTAFGDAVRQAVEVARTDLLVTLGIEPTFPSTAFGYLRMGEEIPGSAGVRRLLAFEEKPSRERAEEYLRAGEHRWNAGMFVARPGVLLDLLARWHPEFAATLRAIAADESRLTELWPSLPRIAVDHAIAEPAAEAGLVAAVPVSFGWEDIGDFDALATLLEVDVPGGSRRPVTLGDADLVHALDTTGIVVPGSGRRIALLGLTDIVVVDTPDAVLVTTRARAQELKLIVGELPEELT